jgi:limonene 1,2-monooxygenase
MRFGVFTAPFHPAGQNPTLALERDLDLAVLLDRLGFDELWMGEHHSGGVEIVPCPELFVAVAAERTRHLRLGSGVVSLPFHNPFMVAHRAAFLDHLTRGRYMLGCGPGQLASDARMLGIRTEDLRPRMAEAMDVVVRLLRGEVVTSRTEWFTLEGARLNLGPWSGENFEMAVTGTISANGARTAGRYGVGLLSVAATTPEGFASLRGHWHEYQKAATDHGVTAERDRWRCVGPVHLAETRQQARHEVGYGFAQWAEYFHHIAPGGWWKGSTVEELLASNDESRTAIVGTPDDAIERISQIQEESGGFGTYLIMASDWASPDATRRSLELFAHHVMPRFNGRADAPLRSWKWVDESREEFAAANSAAIQKYGLVEPRPRS